jgi:hypothetical protein
MSVQSNNVPEGNWGFVEQAARLYTRQVFFQFNKTANAATRFHCVLDTDEGPTTGSSSTRIDLARLHGGNTSSGS